MRSQEVRWGKDERGRRYPSRTPPDGGSLFDLEDDPSHTPSRFRSTDPSREESKQRQLAPDDPSHLLGNGMWRCPALVGRRRPRRRIRPRSRTEQRCQPNETGYFADGDSPEHPLGDPSKVAVTVGERACLRFRSHHAVSLLPTSFAFYLFLLSVIFSAVPAAPVEAIVSSPHPFQEVQPDGLTVEIHIVGDVEYHRMTDDRGYTVIRDDTSGWLVYARRDDDPGSPGATRMLMSGGSGIDRSGEGRLVPTNYRVGIVNPEKVGGLRWDAVPSDEVMEEECYKFCNTPVHGEEKGKTSSAAQAAQQQRASNFSLGPHLPAHRYDGGTIYPVFPEDDQTSEAPELGPLDEHKGFIGGVTYLRDPQAEELPEHGRDSNDRQDETQVRDVNGSDPVHFSNRKRHHKLDRRDLSGVTEAAVNPNLNKGTLRNLVFLLRFSDHRDRDLPTSGDVATLLNSRGGHTNLAPTGSVRDVFLQSSYGTLDVRSTIIPWINVPKKEAYYADGASGATKLFEEALRYVLDEFDANVDFSSGFEYRDYDKDDDGIIDSIMFLHSGYGAEWGATDCKGKNKRDRIWAHKWKIAPEWSSRPVGRIGLLSFRGISSGGRSDESGATTSNRNSFSQYKVGKYHTSSALWGTCGSELARIGTVSHEIGHVLGLPGEVEFLLYSSVLCRPRSQGDTFLIT